MLFSTGIVEPRSSTTVAIFPSRRPVNSGTQHSPEQIEVEQRMKRYPLTGRISTRMKSETVARSRRLPVRKNTVLYESNSGRGAVCNPEAIFRGLVASPDHSHLSHIWVLDEDCLNDPIVDEFKSSRNVKFVRYQSLAYYHALGTSQYLFNNSTFPPEFAKRPEQTYVNTWHGTPLKKMGYDVVDGGPDTRNIIRNFLAADFVLSPNSFTTQRMLREGYRLDGIFRGKIAEVGYPRVDAQFAGSIATSNVLRQLRDHGVSIPQGKKIAVYAPTWKGASFYDPLDEMEEVSQFVAELQAELGTDWRVLLKLHQRVMEQADGHPDIKDRLVPNHVPANCALSVADALITDYSSIFYDYQALDRPLCFYIPDFETYSEYRGVYQDPQSWPGPIVATAEAAAAAITSEPSEEVANRRREARAVYNAYDDGRATQRVIDIVFNENESPYNVVSDFSTGKTSILLYPGGLLPNGITTSVINLLNSLDYEKFDVSIAYAHGTKPAIVDFLSRIDSRIRLLPRIGRFYTGKTPVEQVMGTEFAWGPDARSPRARKDFRDEWRRCFGDAEFDHVVDFSGYGPLWAGIFAAAPSGKKSIWQHNDMVSEISKEIDGSTPHSRRLNQVFDLYNDFDRVVAVSPTLRDINASGLQHLAPNTEFTFARNIIDGGYVLDRAHPSVDELADTVQADKGTDLRTTIKSLITATSPEMVERVVEHEVLTARYAPPTDGTTFLTIGRMSPEKNQARMINAFAQVHRTSPRSRLIIVGDGPLMPTLKTMAASLGLSDSVVFTGQIPNPFPLYAAADCFVLSSDYEGQPMVILESLVVGVPIVSTRFASITDALNSEEGLIVDRDEHALAQGMKAALTNDIPQKPFDWKAYNQEALEEFLQAIGSR